MSLTQTVEQKTVMERPGTRLGLTKVMKSSPFPRTPKASNKSAQGNALRHELNAAEM